MLKLQNKLFTETKTPLLVAGGFKNNVSIF